MYEGRCLGAGGEGFCGVGGIGLSVCTTREPCRGFLSGGQAYVGCLH